MKLTRVAFGVAYLYLNLAVLGRSFSEASPDGSPDTAIAVKENYALADQSSKSSTSAPGLEEHRISTLHFHPVLQDRRSLRNVQFIPPEADDTLNLKEQKRGRNVSIAPIVAIVVLGMSLVLFVAVVFWYYRKKKNDPVEWRFLDLFKRKTPQTDQEKLYDQVKDDTNLSGY